MRSLQNLTQKRRLPHGPCWSLTEFAAEVGVTAAVLGKFLAQDPNSPPPISRRGLDSGQHCATRYELGALRRWWQQRSAKGVLVTGKEA